MVQMLMTETSLADAAERAHHGDRVILCRDGEPFCAVVPVADAEWIDRAEDEADVRAAEEALSEPGFVPWPGLKAELGLE